jgi:hypothetical protein
VYSLPFGTVCFVADDGVGKKVVHVSCVSEDAPTADAGVEGVLIGLFDSEEKDHVRDTASGVVGSGDKVECASELVDAEAERRIVRICDGFDFDGDWCEVRCVRFSRGVAEHPPDRVKDVVSGAAFVGDIESFAGECAGKFVILVGEGGSRVSVLRGIFLPGVCVPVVGVVFENL